MSILNANYRETRGRPTMRSQIRVQVLAVLSTPAEPVVPAEVAGRVRAVRERAEARLRAGPE